MEVVPMADPFLAEIRMFGFNFAPRGWAKCDGQILPINQNQSLYALLGTTYGGDGRTTFALPDLRSRTPAHPNHSGGLPQSLTLGQKKGAETHQLDVNEMPAHNHTVTATGDQGSDNSINSVPADGATNTFASQARGDAAFYNANDTSSLVYMDATTLSNAGASSAHNNMQPSLTINFCIALTGLFPSRS
jgi:microcystin-dependent protein